MSLPGVPRLPRAAGRRTAALSILSLLLLGTFGVVGLASPVHAATLATSPITSFSIGCPTSIAFDPSGNLWVADSCVGVAYAFASPYTGPPIATVNLGGSDVPYYDPGFGIAFDSSGDLWACSPYLGYIVEFTNPLSSPSSPALFLGSSNNVYSPTRLAFDSSGNLWFASSGGPGAYIGEIPSTITSSSNAVYPPSPVGEYLISLAFDSSGSLWFTDSASGHIGQITSPRTSFGTGAYLTASWAPSGLAFDSSGNLWAASFVTPDIYEFSNPSSDPSSPTNVLTFPGLTATSGACGPSPTGPFAIAFDPSGDLWAASPCVGAVFEFLSPGAPTPVSAYSVTVSAHAPDGSPIDAAVNLNGAVGYTGIGDSVTFAVPSAGSYTLVVSAPGYPTYTSTVDVSSYSTSIDATLGGTSSSSSGPSSSTPGQTFSSAGASSLAGGGLTGASASFTNTASASQTVNVWFVWYNSANQVVNIGEQLNVQFSAGQTISFTGTYGIPGTYTVRVFLTDANSNGLTQAYTASVTVP